MQTTLLARSAAAVAALSILAACGGGGGSTPIVTPSAGPTATATPTVAPTQNPTTQSESVPVSAAPSNDSIPSVGGFSGSLQLPSSTASSGTTITATSSTVSPAGLPALQVRRRNTSVTATYTAYFFLSITPSSSFTFSEAPGFTLTLPDSISTAGQDFYIAIFGPGATSWQLAADGPAQVSGQTITFPPQPGAQVTLTAGQTYYFAFYSVPTPPSPSPSPSVSPSTSPSPSPSPSASPSAAPVQINLSPSSLSFLDTSANDTQTFTASEDGYAGAFSVQPNCMASDGVTTVATIAQQGGTNTFVVTPVAAGTCFAGVYDANSNSAILNVSVTTTTVGGQ